MVRETVERYWRQQPTAGPDRWLADAAAAHAPALGEHVELPGVLARYVHCYGREGRAVHEDGTVSLTWMLFGECRRILDLGQAAR